MRTRQATIREIDEFSRQKFQEAFEKINENFQFTFQQAVRRWTGIHAAHRRIEPSESGIDVVASPPGKKLQNVLLLSGGEKALTALSLLVGIFQYQPSPFCILDEVDAPLDEANVGRFTRTGKGDVRADAIHRHHSQQENHGCVSGDVWRDHAGARRLKNCLRQVRTGRKYDSGDGVTGGVRRILWSAVIGAAIEAPLAIGLINSRHGIDNAYSRSDGMPDCTFAGGSITRRSRTADFQRKRSRMAASPCFFHSRVHFFNGHVDGLDCQRKN